MPITPTSSTALFVSPHLDDAAFSCGGTAARLSGLGWRAVLATVFTASVPDPRGFALACQTDKGIPATTDYMALRRAEEEAACERLGAESVTLGYREAPHRGYESASELFSGVREEEDVHRAVRESLAGLVRGLEPDLVFAPQGLGGHVDHLQTIRALQAVREAPPGRLLYYRDAPYALRAPDAEPAISGVELVEAGAEVRHGLPDKLRACEAYTSQLDFQFGGDREMRRALQEFAGSEGDRLGLGEPAEAYLGSRAAVAALDEAFSVRDRNSKRDHV